MDEIESIEFDGDDDDDRDVQWRDEEDEGELLIERARRAVLKRLKHWINNILIRKFFPTLT